MTKCKRRMTMVLFSQVALLGALAAATPVGATPVASRDAVAGALGGPGTTVVWDRNGQIRSARGELGILGPGTVGIDAFLRERAGVLGLRDDESFGVLLDETDRVGNRHVRATRVVHGVTVAFDQLRIHARRD